MSNSVESKLKAIAGEKFPGWSFVLDDWKSADRAIAGVTVPAILCLLPSGGKVVAKNGKAVVSKDCALAFLTRVKRDADGADNVEAYEEMLQAAIRFYGEIYKAGMRVPDEVEFTTIYEGTANILTGVLMSVSITDNTKVCL